MDGESNGGGVVDGRLILELDFAERILGNITKTVSCVVFDLDNSAFDYDCYGLNDGDRGRRRAADEI